MEESKSSVFKKGLKSVQRFAFKAVMKTSSGFRYSEELPIKHPQETRFIELFSGKEEDDICIDLVCRDARTPARFGALSYVWGAPTDPLPIYIGKHHRQVVYVTQSLDAALRSMRKRLNKGDSAFYWIDALSINQQDNAEKSQQIPLMPLIYPAAYLTYCWLGAADETTDKTFTIIENCAQYLKTDNLEMIRAVLMLVTTELGSQDRPFVDGLQRLLRKPWFERAWILQESCRPINDTPHLVCGSRSLELLDLSKVVKCLRETLFHEELERLFGDGEQAALNCLEVATTDRSDFTFSYLLETMALRKAQNPRDKFYALLGLIADSDTIYPKPDYDAPLETVSISYTRSIIINERSLAVLQSLHPTIELASSEQPSWCLNPTTLPGRRSISGVHRRLENSVIVNDFQTTGGSTLVLPQQDLFDPVLTLKGQVIDEIATVSSGLELRELLIMTTSWAELTKSLHEALTAKGLLDANRSTQEQMTAAARALTADRFFALHSSQRAYEHDHFAEFYLRYRDRITGSRVPTSSAIEGKLMSKESLLEWSQAHLRFDNDALSGLQSTESLPVDFLAATAAKLFARAILDLNLICTASGHIGLAPNSAKPGDPVVLFTGATAPLILQKAIAASEPSWLVLGESYIDEVMSGELYDDSKLQDLRLV